MPTGLPNPKVPQRRRASTGTPLKALCSIIRSKQAGPFRLTLDVVFRDHVSYERAKRGRAITQATIAALYKIPPEQIIAVVYYDPGWAVKVAMVRPKIAGDPGDGDVYGCQQHVPLLGLRVKLPKN